MKEVLFTSSVLIAALLLLRWLFRNSIPRRVQYALWGLVLARLLLPVSLPAVDFSVLTAAEPMGRQIGSQALYIEPIRESVTAPDSTPVQERTPSDYQRIALDRATQDNTRVFTDQKDVTHTVQYARQISLEAFLYSVWLAGMSGMAVWLLVSNLRFWRKLCKVRTPYQVEGSKYPVYWVDAGLPSPCLFGLLRPAIYVTPAAAASPENLRYVLAHEETHARHFDPLWSLLRVVCLAVYWFHPLVWAAAAASKTDCELACDEAVLARLNAEERIAYGRTLLALIPVRRGPSSPLLSATTMTSDKRHLRDRITRIAENRQTKSAALFLVLALAAVVCAVTFTGAKQPEARPLTGDELAYFNEEFFNNDVSGTNIRNQFLVSLYERPEDIDLYELFYCGIPNSSTFDGITGSSAEEDSLVYGSELPDCPRYKATTSDMDTLLNQYTGLSVEETTGKGLENFTYLSQYDAYYWAHGDTNYFANVLITAGERIGNTIQLYYRSAGVYGSGAPGWAFEDAAWTDAEYPWACVTLEEQPDGSFWFVSNLPSKRPVISTVFPEVEPVLTIPLTDLAPYQPEPVAVTRRIGDCAERGGGMLIHGMDGSEISFRPYLSTDGNLYAAVIYDEAVGNSRMIAWDAGCFFTFPEGTGLDDVSIDFFSDLFGYEGLVLSYLTQESILDYQRSIIHDYYYFQDPDTPVLLARVYGGDTAILDLDGDGASELFTDGNQLLFQRGGQLYHADITALLENNWPEMIGWDYSLIDTNRRCLFLCASVPLSGEANVSGTAVRRIYFDGENLLVYKDTAAYTDHIADSIDAPEMVLSAARDHVLEELSWWQTHTGQQSYVNGVWHDSGTQAEWDDWRITSLELVDTAPAYPELGIQVYSYGYELHTATPALTVMAGGMYMDEDGWVGGMNSDNLLVFHTLTDSGPTLLESSIPTDVGRTSDNPMFAACLARVLLENDLLPPSQVRPRDLYYMFYDNQTIFLNLMGRYDTQEQEAALGNLTEYAASIADTDDGSLFSGGLQNLEWNSSALTESGREAYGQLLAAVAGAPTEAGRTLQTTLEQMAGSVTLDLTLADGRGGGAYPAALEDYWSYRLENYPSDFRWTFADNPVPPENAASLTLSSGNGAASVQCWQGVNLVRCTLRDETVWLAAPITGADAVYDGTLFSALREWYDGLEWDALQADILIPDEGQSHLKIAQAWSDAATQSALAVTSGSIFACTYVRAIAGVDSWADMPETSYPDASEGHERFWFSYTRIFVPETQHARNYQMAGNTGDYDGRYGEAPEGAFENFQVGVLYRTEEGWRCDGTGTGP